MVLLMVVFMVIIPFCGSAPSDDVAAVRVVYGRSIVSERVQHDVSPFSVVYVSDGFRGPWFLYL